MGKMVIVALFAILLLTQDAYAYLDPSAGSIIIQVLLGGVAGLFILVKMYWGKIKQMLGFGPKGGPSHDEPK